MKVGGNRNYGYGKSLAWAGKNALKDRYGQGHFATQAAHAARWAKFAAFAKNEGIRDARKVTRELVRAFASSLASQVETQAMSVRYAQNLLSSVNVILESLRGDRHLRLAPARLVGQRVNVREQPPASLNRQLAAEQIARLEEHRHHRVAAIASLARELGLRFREASLLDSKEAYRQARDLKQINVTRGTKGGRGREVERWIPVPAPALASLARAAVLQGDGKNLLPADMNFRAWRDHAYGVWGRATKGSSLKGFHDLRVAYACERYATLTGAPAPVVAGRRSAIRAIDRAARAVIAQELGHARTEVLGAYIGSSR